MEDVGSETEYSYDLAGVQHLSVWQLNLCNREIFLFHFDHHRYEALLQESCQVQETVSFDT